MSKAILNYFSVVNYGELQNCSKFAEYIQEVEKINGVAITKFNVTKDTIRLIAEHDYWEVELIDNDLQLMKHGTCYVSPTNLGGKRPDKLTKAREIGEAQLRDAHKSMLTAGTVKERKYYQNKFEHLEFLLLESKISNSVRIDQLKWETEYINKKF